MKTNPKGHWEERKQKPEHCMPNDNDVIIRMCLQGLFPASQRRGCETVPVKVEEE